MFIKVVAAEVSFTIVPPSGVVVGDRFNVVYRLENAQGSNLNAPAIQGCQQLYGPSQSMSQSVQMINGNTTSTSSVSYTYVYRADKDGTYTIPEATISVNGKTLKAASRTFNVLPADSRPSSGSSSANRPGNQPDRTGSPEKVTADDVFVRLIFNKTNVYEQEAVECTIRLYTRYNISSFARKDAAKFDGFLIEEVDPNLQLSNMEHYNGRNYYVADIKKCIIFPQRAGDLSVTSGSYDIVASIPRTISTGFIPRTIGVDVPYVIPSKSATIHVKPLPVPAPEGFFGAVGNMTASASVSATELRTGEAASITYTVSGSGNIKYIKGPEIAIPDEFEQYPQNQTVDASMHGSTVSGRQTFEYTFVPQEAGNFTIRIPDFVCFNPATGKYETTEMPDFDMSVAKGNATATSTVENTIRVKNTDILHIHTGGHHLTDNPHHYLVDNVIYWMMYVLGIVILVAVTVLLMRRHKALADVVGRRSSRAGKEAKKRLRTAVTFMRKHQNREFYDAILRALQGYLSDRMRIPVSELNRDNISSRLLEFGNSKESVDEVINLLDDCEMAHYTPDSDALTPQSIYDRATSVINTLKS